jgi:hypothetical protein
MYVTSFGLIVAALLIFFAGLAMGHSERDDEIKQLKEKIAELEQETEHNNDSYADYKAALTDAALTGKDIPED